jgi:hypothetical protein
LHDDCCIGLKAGCIAESTNRLPQNSSLAEKTREDSGNQQGEINIRCVSPERINGRAEQKRAASGPDAPEWMQDGAQWQACKTSQSIVPIRSICSLA